MKLNHPKNIGTVTRLIMEKKFQTPREWILHYLQSGEKRLKLLSEGKHGWEIDANYGRTIKELLVVADKLYQGVVEKGNPLGITPEECKKFVYKRIFVETWEGVIKREVNTVDTLEKVVRSKLGLKLYFQKTDGVDDAQYAVDYEIYDQYHCLLLGIQIKPISYLKASKETLGDTQELNIEKNAKYSKLKGVPVQYVYSKINGCVENEEEVLLSIETAINMTQKVV